jgi:hypothetical protein
MYFVKLRSPIAVILLCVLTLGLYYFYWFYKVNEEAAILNDDDAAKPGLSVLAASLGWLLIIPPFWTHWTTANRIGLATGFRFHWTYNLLISIVVPLLLFFPIATFVYVIWIQGKLNKYGRRQRAQAHRSVAVTHELQSMHNWS